jgi:hypothetical protein
MVIKNKEGKTMIEIDDLTLIFLFGIIAFMVVGHC